MLTAVSSNVSGLLRGLTQARERLRARALPLIDRIDRASASVELNQPWLETALGALDPTLSLHMVRARVVGVNSETADVKTFWLRPNARFRTHRAGAYVNVRVPIRGRIHERSYSISSAARDNALISITVKRVPGGVVSNWLADTLVPGHILTLSAPSGQFLLPPELPPKLVMISAGSGITPVMSMLRTLAARATCPPLAFLHCARSPRDVIFGSELEQLAQKLPDLRLSVCVEQADADWTGAQGRFSTRLLEELAPDFASLPAFLCGPAGFMQAVMKTYEQAGALSNVRFESFGGGFDASAFLQGAQLIRFLRSGTQRVSDQPRTILEEAEQLGLDVPFGCRAGNCGTCRCTKKSGVVVDVITGRESGAGEEFIFPCVSVARGTVEVVL